MHTTALSPHLTGRPVIWDADEAGLDAVARSVPVSPRVRQRSVRLARGLSSLGVAAGQRVVVLCCAGHLEDRAVAVAALESLGAVPVVPIDWSEPTLARLFTNRTGPNVHVACEEGVAAWRAVRGTGIMVGEGDGVIWWKGLECRHSSEVRPAS